MYTKKALSDFGTLHNSEGACWNNHLVEEETEIKNMQVAAPDSNARNS